jgi:hypothetical protein
VSFFGVYRQLGNFVFAAVECDPHFTGCVPAQCFSVHPFSVAARTFSRAELILFGEGEQGTVVAGDFSGTAVAGDGKNLFDQATTLKSPCALFRKYLWQAFRSFSQGAGRQFYMRAVGQASFAKCAFSETSGPPEQQRRNSSHVLDNVRYS